MDLAGKKIGIWGYGVTGKSAVPFFTELGCAVGVVEKRPLTEQELKQLADDHVTIWPHEQLESFFNAHDFIFTSGSIDLRPHGQWQHKWLSEVDIIQQYAAERLGSPKVVAITGTVGKTTVTRLLAHTLTHAGFAVGVSGNVGSTAMKVSFDLLRERPTLDFLIFELSSYQLEISKTFAPDVAVWTNFYPNHLDRHGSAQNYFDAKAKIFTYQTREQCAIMPEKIAQDILPQARTLIITCENTPRRASFDNTQDTHPVLIEIGVPETRVPFQGDFGEKGSEREDDSLPQTQNKIQPHVTYPENIALIQATLQSLNLHPQLLEDASATFERDAHRLEKVATISGIDIYNDSKSTVPQATIAAVHALQHKPIILLLGGVSKGVDRSSMMQNLHESCANNLKMIICFGGEAQQLHQYVQQTTIASVCCATLDDAWSTALASARPGDQILLSPAGASFDLFKDYQERGNMFKKLVHQSQQEKGSL